MNCFFLERSRRSGAELTSLVPISELLNINVYNIKIILIKFSQSNSNLLDFILLTKCIKYQYIKMLCFFEHTYPYNTLGCIVTGKMSISWYSSSIYMQTQKQVK